MDKGKSRVTGPSGCQRCAQVRDVYNSCYARPRALPTLLSPRDLNRRRLHAHSYGGVLPARAMQREVGPQGTSNVQGLPGEVEQQGDLGIQGAQGSNPATSDTPKSRHMRMKSCSSCQGSSFISCTACRGGSIGNNVILPLCMRHQQCHTRKLQCQNTFS